MPYGDIYEKNGRYCFRNKDTGQERCCDTRTNAERQKRLLNAVHHGFKPTGAKAKR